MASKNFVVWNVQEGTDCERREYYGIFKKISVSAKILSFFFIKTIRVPQDKYSHSVEFEGLSWLPFVFCYFAGSFKIRTISYIRTTS